MKLCPRCGYENNRDGAQMCSLCGGVFPDVAAKLDTLRPPGHYRKDFAREITDNRVGSLSLLIGFPILIVMLGAAFGLWFGSAPVGVVGALFLAVILMIVAWYEGDQTILKFSGAVEASPETDAMLINVVDEMRIAAGLPMPRVYIIESETPNAFATGRDPDKASVAVTRGLLDTLTREELQGVIGHEMSHVRNLDIRYMMLVAALVGSVVLLSDGLRRGMWWGGGRRRSRGGGGGGAILLLLALLLAILAPLFAGLLQMAISRKREFLADASSVELTRNPLALASALEKLDTAALTHPLPAANRATQHLFIVNPLRAYDMTAKALFSTHPPTEARIRVLRAMADAA
jgi:heat shock protein HtpX